MPATNASDFCVLPVSPAQQRLWVEEQFNPGTAAYNIAAVLHLGGRLRADPLERKLRRIIERHEILRTTFGTLKGQPMQVIAPRGGFALPRFDLRQFDKTKRNAEAARITKEVTVAPFDRVPGPLVRAALLT